MLQLTNGIYLLVIFSTQWQFVPRHHFLITMDSVRIALLISVIARVYMDLPFLVPISIWIIHDILIFITVFFLRNLVLRKLYLFYALFSYFGGLQLRVFLVINCGEQCTSEVKFFYFAFLIPIVYGIVFALFNMYLARIYIDDVVGIRQGSKVLTGVSALVGVLHLTTLPIVISDTFLDVWTFKASFFATMLVLTAVTVSYKSNECSKYK